MPNIIKYGVRPNPLQEGQYAIKIIHTGVVGLTDLVAEINKEVLVSKITVDLVINAMAKIIPRYLALGYIVQVPGLLSARLQLGTPPGQVDPNSYVDAENVIMAVDARMPLATLEEIKASIVAYEREPIPDKVPLVEDLLLLSSNSGQHHNAIRSDMSGSIIRLSGENLKINTSDGVQGLRFKYNPEGGFADGYPQEMKVENALSFRNTDRYYETSLPVIDKRRQVSADGVTPIVYANNFPLTLSVTTKYTPEGSYRVGTYTAPIVDYDTL